MGLRYVLGDALATAGEMAEKAASGDLKKLDDAVKESKPEFSLPFSNGEASSKSVVMKPLDESGKEVEHESFGIGTPLSIMIRHVYTGAYPKAGLFDDDEDMLVTSAMKGIEVYDGMPRAVNFMKKDVTAKSNVAWAAATEVGTNLIYYSPALTELSSVLTIEMAFDEFPDEVFNMAAKVAKGAGGMPIFAPAAGYLMAGGNLIQIARDIGKYFLESGPVFKVTEPLALDLPGEVPTAAGFILLMSTEQAVREVEKDHRVDASGRLVRMNDMNVLYRGKHPYVVLSLDGRKRPKFESFVPHAATAELIENFYGTRGNPSAGADVALDALELLNDWKFRQKAERLEKERDKIEDKASKAYKDLDARYKAALANIKKDELKPKSE